MWLRAIQTRSQLGVLLVGVGLLASGVWAGIPEPGVVLCGQIWGSNNSLLTSGELTFTFTPSGGGATVTVKTPLQLIDSAIGRFSYAVMVPVETGVPGFPVAAGALAVSGTPITYAWSAVVKNTSISDSGTLPLDMSALGSALRLDFGAASAPGQYHSGDTNRDNRFSLGELLRELEIYTATPAHEYSCDSWWVDGYGLGPGDHTCGPHSGDWDGGADWHISTNELLRMIELFSATATHAYCADPSNPEDGFRTGPCGKDGDGKAAPGGGIPVLTMVRAISRQSDDSLLVTISYRAEDFSRISAMALEEWPPLQYQYVEVVSGAAPGILPKPGAVGKLEFVWVGVPAVADSFTYRLRPISVPRADASFYGETVYRAKEIPGEWRTVVQIGRYPAGINTASGYDSDLDGIPDAVEGGRDVDMDGIPNFQDDDSDADGLPDAEESYEDDDGDGLPGFEDKDSDNDGILDAAERAEGEADADGDGLPNSADPDADGDGIPDAKETGQDTDGDGTPNYLDLDSDQDGVPDAVESGLGLDPYDSADAASVPVLWAPAALALGALGLWALRRPRKRH